MTLPKGKRGDLHKLTTIEEWSDYVETHDMADVWERLPAGELPWETDDAGNAIHIGDDSIDET